LFYPSQNIFYDFTAKGRTIRKVMGGGSKNKNRAGETERKKIRAPIKFEKKSCRDFSIGKTENFF
jgi:hypothetical protein